MSRYIAITILAIAAAVISTVEVAVTLEQPDGAPTALMVRP
jgi:hypothetical protein